MRLLIRGWNGTKPYLELPMRRRCGQPVLDAPLHEQWHGEQQAAKDALEEATSLLAELTSRIAFLEEAVSSMNLSRQAPRASFR